MTKQTFFKQKQVDQEELLTGEGSEEDSFTRIQRVIKIQKAKIQEEKELKAAAVPEEREIILTAEKQAEDIEEYLK